MAGPRAIGSVYGSCEVDGHATSVRGGGAMAKGARVSSLGKGLRLTLPPLSVILAPTNPIWRNQALVQSVQAPPQRQRQRRLRPAYSTNLGTMFIGTAEQALDGSQFEEYLSSVQLIFTSPPFPLNRKKAYGNFTGEAYASWLASFASRFKRYLCEGGSIVMEIGNAWEQGQPTMSTLALESLLKFLKDGELFLCQQFVCTNPARLPSPAQWVNVDRARLKDAFTHIWWMSPTERPKADNRKVLSPYSSAMKKLLKTKRYNAGKRPSEHSIGSASFLKDNGGAIPSNVIRLSNTSASDPYQQYCRDNNIEPHPARMPLRLAEFFIRFLTEPGDLVMDPFAGSNVTGAAAESLERRWLSIEPVEIYAKASKSRFRFANA